MNKDKKIDILISKINPFFIATSIANIFWIFAWHYDYIGLSVFIMVTLLLLLIKIADIIRVEQFTRIGKFIIRAPFSIYFGWITVASIANITVLLVSLGWDGFGIADFVWMNIILLVGAGIGIIRMLKDKNIPYGLVLVWAYSWILFKHMSPSGFDGVYPTVIVTVIICITLFLFFIGKLIFRK